MEIGWMSFYFRLDQNEIPSKLDFPLHPEVKKVLQEIRLGGEGFKAGVWYHVTKDGVHEGNKATRGESLRRGCKEET